MRAATPPTTDADRCLQALLVDDATCRGPLEQAWADAARRGDHAACRLLAALALLAIELEMADFRGLSTWVERFGADDAPTTPDAPPADALRIDAARVALPALDHRYGYDAAPTRAAAARLLDALHQGRWPGGDEHALLAKVLHEYHGMEYDQVACERIAALATPGVRTAAASWQARWWCQLEDCLGFWGHPDAAAQARDELARLAQADPAPVVAWTLAVVELRHALRGNDATSQDRAYAQVDRLRTLQRPGRALQGLRWQATLLLQRGRFQAALDKADLLLGLSADVEVPERDRGLYHELRAQALAGVGRWEEALQVLQSLRSAQTGGQGRIVEALIAAMQAAAALSGPQAADVPTVDATCLHALREAARNAWPRFLGYFPDLASQVADTGLRHGVEVEFATAAIRDRRLLPRARWRDDWPWRVKVRVLGPLTVERDGQPLVVTGRGPRKPLELLSLLASNGGGPLEAEAVIDELWPSLDANSPRASLDMAVSRLRKLLDLPDAVLLADGRLSLNPALVWTDVAAFEALADLAASGDAAAAARALALHADRLRGSEVLSEASTARRHQLLQRLASLALAHAQQLLARGEAPQACRVLQRALRCDATSAPLNAALAEAQLALARPPRD